MLGIIVASLLVSVVLGDVDLVVFGVTMAGLGKCQVWW